MDKSRSHSAIDWGFFVFSTECHQRQLVVKSFIDPVSLLRGEEESRQCTFQDFGSSSEC